MQPPVIEKIRMSLIEFFALPESTQPTELFDGEIIVSPAPAFRHQKLIYRLAKLIEKASGGIEPHLSPIDVVLDAGTVVQPDILWIAPDSPRCVERDGRLQGPPDLCVEILSPSTARLDRTTKFMAYERAGVTEYWILDPTAEIVEVWALKEGEYTPMGVYRAPHTFTSPVLNGATLNTTEIFA